MMMQKSFGVLALVMGLTSPGLARADVNIGINVGAPAPPPIVVAAPPRLVIVSDSSVYYAPGLRHNLFVYGGRYYSLHNGSWFYASTGGGSWAVIAADRVPQPVLAVPVAYYKVPPGHAKKMGGDIGPVHAKAHSVKAHGKAKKGKGHDQ